jgi:lipopolysaccharide transport system ATP-binding protein
MRIRLHFDAPQPLEGANFVVSFIRSDDVACCNYNTAMDNFAVPVLKGPGVIELLTPPLKLVADLYALEVLVWDTAFQKLFAAQQGSTFHVRHELLSPQFGVFHEPAKWCWK